MESQQALSEAAGVRKASPALSVAMFVVSVFLLATAGVAALLWNGLDEFLIARADDAGWDQSMLLPHQNLIWLAVNATVVLAAGLTVMAFVGMGSAVKRSRAQGQLASARRVGSRHVW